MRNTNELRTYTVEADEWDDKLAKEFLRTYTVEADEWDDKLAKEFRFFGIHTMGSDEVIRLIKKLGRARIFRRRTPEGSYETVLYFENGRCCSHCCRSRQ